MSTKSKAHAGLGAFIDDGKVYLCYQRPLVGRSKFCLALGENPFEFSLQSDLLSFSAGSKIKKEGAMPSRQDADYKD